MKPCLQLLFPENMRSCRDSNEWYKFRVMRVPCFYLILEDVCVLVMAWKDYLVLICKDAIYPFFWAKRIPGNSPFFLEDTSMRIWFAYVGTVWSTLMVLISSWLILLAVTADFNCCWCLVLFKLLSNFPYLVIPVWHSCHKIITRLPGKISWLRAVEWRALATYSNICWFSYDLLTYRLTSKCSVENKFNLK